jgi:hypothetical protein
MYFGQVDPFSDILRCLEDRIDDDMRFKSKFDIALHQELTNPTRPDQANRKRNTFVVTPLDMIGSGMREPDVVDGWTPADVMKFDCLLIKNKRFSLDYFQDNMKNKRKSDLINFYNFYSKTENFKILSKILNESKPTEISSDSSDDEIME